MYCWEVGWKVGEQKLQLCQDRQHKMKLLQIIIIIIIQVVENGHIKRNTKTIEIVFYHPETPSKLQQ